MSWCVSPGQILKDKLSLCGINSLFIYHLKIELHLSTETFTNVPYSFLVVFFLFLVYLTTFSQIWFLKLDTWIKGTKVSQQSRFCPQKTSPGTNPEK